MLTINLNIIFFLMLNSNFSIKYYLILLYFSDYFDDSDLLILRKSMQNLKIFHFIAYDHESAGDANTKNVLTRILPIIGPKLTKLCIICNQSLDLDAAFKVIESRQSTMKELCLICSSLSDDFLKAISRLKELDLTSVTLFPTKDNNNITNIGLRELLKSQRNIRKLHIVSFREISDESLLVISEYLPNISILKIMDERKCFTEVSFL